CLRGEHRRATHAAIAARALEPADFARAPRPPRRPMREIVGDSKHQLLSRLNVAFFQFLAIGEESRLGATLAEQLARLIVEVRRIWMIALAQRNNHERFRRTRQLHDLRRRLPALAD